MTLRFYQKIELNSFVPNRQKHPTRLFLYLGRDNNEVSAVAEPGQPSYEERKFKTQNRDGAS